MTINISSLWTKQDREAVCLAIDGALSEARAQLDNSRLTILWRAPHIAQLEHRIAELNAMRYILANADAGFLEKNRANFSEFVE